MFEHPAKCDDLMRCRLDTIDTMQKYLLNLCEWMVDMQTTVKDQLEERAAQLKERAAQLEERAALLDIVHERQAIVRVHQSTTISSHVIT